MDVTRRAHELGRGDEGLGRLLGQRLECVDDVEGAVEKLGNSSRYPASSCSASRIRSSNRAVFCHTGYRPRAEVRRDVFK